MPDEQDTTADDSLNELIAEHSDEAEAIEAEVTEEASEEATEEVAQEATSVLDDESRRALKRTSHGKWTDDKIDAMFESNPDLMREIAEGAAAYQSGVDTKFSEDASIKNELAELRKALDFSGNNRDTTSVPNQPSDVDSVIAQAESRLRDVLGDDESAALAGALKAIQSKLNMQQEQYDSSIRKSEGRVEQIENKASKNALLADYPQLKDKDVFGRVLKRMKTFESSDYDDHTAHMEAAAKFELMDELIENAKAGVKMKRDARDAGTPRTAGKGSKTVESSRTAQDVIDEGFTAMARGDTKKMDELQKELSRLK